MIPAPAALPPRPKSHVWSIAVLAFCVVECLLAGYYVFLFFATDPTGDLQAILDLREWLLPASPIIVLAHFFVLALWVHTLYVDMHDLFGNKNLDPQRAMFEVLIPVVNLYGIGMNLSRVVAEADKLEARDRSAQLPTRPFNQCVKFGLPVFYAAVGSLLLGLTLYAFRMPFDGEMLAREYFKVFNIVLFVAVFGAIAGLALAVVGSQGIVTMRHRAVKRTALNGEV
jgi:hypothetical protein